MALGDRINAIRKEKKISIDELCALSNIPKGTLSKITAGITGNPTLETVKSIAYALGCTLDDLDDNPPQTVKEIPLYSFEEDEHIKKYRILDVHGKRVVDSALNLEYDRMTHVVEQEQKGAITYINCYDLAVSAGPGEPWADDAGYKTRIEIPTEQVPEEAHYCVRVNGNSMEPAYKDGDILFVKRQDEMVRPGEIGIFYLNGEGYVKRLGHNCLESLNPQYNPIPLREYDDIRCQGRVLGRV